MRATKTKELNIVAHLCIFGGELCSSAKKACDL
jgi:hypothetical protein